ncbi:MAG: capsule assembly Wzi family protein [Pseudomonadota bacterium]
MAVRGCLALIITVLVGGQSHANPLLDPGDILLRHDLELLNDSGVINVPLTAWPLSVGDIDESLRAIDDSTLSLSVAAAFARVKNQIATETNVNESRIAFDVSASVEPRFIRTFEATPRDEGEVGASFAWVGERISVRLAATGIANPFDGDDFRPDGSYVGVALGNWMLTAGWQDRWWGPSRDGSLILSSNARPTPGVMLQRNSSQPFRTKWLSWMGPWTLTTFMSELDDERAVANARLFGIRGTFRPPKTGLEIGFSRTAQWCGDGRPCSLGTFGDLLLGKDNRGVNIDPENEPGNQLAGVDIRWKLPGETPVALYMQWIGEDGRGGGEGIGSWLRQIGGEFWGEVGSIRHRTHVEVSDSTCRQGGFGFSDQVPGCAYHHSIYSTGYRYQSRAIAHAMDGDGLSYSIGSTLVQSAGQVWNVSLRHMEINRAGSTRPGHSVSATPAEITDFQVSHARRFDFGTIRVGISTNRKNGLASGDDSTDMGGFLQWSSH